MRNKVMQVLCGIENMRKILERMKEQNAYSRVSLLNYLFPKFFLIKELKKKELQLYICMQELLSLLETLNKRISHQKENVPPELIQGYQNADKQGCIQTQISPAIPKSIINSTHKLIGQKISDNMYNNDIIEETMKDCKRALFNEPEVCPTIPFISAEEFNKVPKYIIGRQTSETINSLISDINNTLITKYTILSLGKAAAQKRGEVNLYLQYKKQEFDIKEEKGKISIAANFCYIYMHTYIYNNDMYYKYNKYQVCICI